MEHQWIYTDEQDSLGNRMWRCAKCGHSAPESMPRVEPVELHDSDVAPWPDCEEQTVSIVMEERDTNPLKMDADGDRVVRIVLDGL